LKRKIAFFSITILAFIVVAALSAKIDAGIIPTYAREQSNRRVLENLEPNSATNSTLFFLVYKGKLYCAPLDGSQHAKQILLPQTQNAPVDREVYLVSAEAKEAWGYPDNIDPGDVYLQPVYHYGFGTIEFCQLDEITIEEYVEKYDGSLLYAAKLSCDGKVCPSLWQKQGFKPGRN